MSHRPAELRSIELHRAVARLIVDDAAVLDRARVKVDAWIAAGGPVDEVRARRWKELLDGSLERLLEELVSDSQEMRDLRQATPFAGVIDPRERWRILREVG
jgi:hypothetical protein